ncbi:MAG: right-handed parallel beta-helix repeat-containing protein [Bacteroidota bacterium]|nr:right-handed parallel beta-helix repeat-containing protein [Bacteroidota bacterium]
MLRYLFICILIALAGQGRGQGRRTVIHPNTDSGYYLHPPEVYRYHPGDTLVLSARDAWTYFTVENYRGRPGRPLVIINEGGQVHMRDGIRLPNDSYVEVSGAGANGGTGGTGAGGEKYGILIEMDPVYISMGGGAMQIGRRSRNIDVHHLFIHHTGIGIVCETNGDCADSLDYPNWVLDSISIHDNRIVGTWNEGMYLGNTSPDNSATSYDSRPVDCNGKTIYPMPMRNGDMRVYRNEVDSTGRGGIQLASASTGMSRIWENTVRHCGLNGDEAQGTGISVGTYSHVSVDHNTISDTYTWGIASLGASGTGRLVRIENNRIDSSGYLVHYRLASASKDRIDPATEPTYPDELDWPYAIELGTRPTLDKDSTTFSITGNAIGFYKSHVAAIQIHDAAMTITKSGNIISDNKRVSDGATVPVYIDNTHGEIHYTDARGVASTEGRVYGRRQRLMRMALWGLCGFIVGLGLVLLVARRRRRRSRSAKAASAP